MLCKTVFAENSLELTGDRLSRRLIVAAGGARPPCTVGDVAVQNLATRKAALSTLVPLHSLSCSVTSSVSFFSLPLNSFVFPFRHFSFQTETFICSFLHLEKHSVVLFYVQFHGYACLITQLFRTRSFSGSRIAPLFLVFSWCDKTAHQ